MMVLVVWGFYIFLAFRKAEEKGRNPFKWAAIAGAAFLVTQISVGVVIIAAVIGFGETAWSSSDTFLKTYNLQITIVSLLACIFTNWLVLRPLNKIE